MLSASKKVKKTASKLENKVQVAAPSEPSSKPSKTLKRKQDSEQNEKETPQEKKTVKPSKTQTTPSSISRTRETTKTSATKSKKAKVAVPEPEPESDDDVEVEERNSNDDSDKDSDEDDHLHGFSTDDDSSDEDAMDDEPSEFDMGKLPTVAKDDATVKRKLEKAKQQPTEDRGVLFLGRLPHGFYEDQLKAYFSQFGNVTRLRVSRNKKTGRSKHYGFIEFDSLAVAEIVAETMDNYLLMGHILRCKLIPKDQVHPELWIGANRKWRVVPKEQVARSEHNKLRTDDEQARATKRLLKRQAERKRKLAKSGINYDFDAVSYKKTKQVEA
ncbi:hypothetical protein GALMADRAFT_247808 [Galerina marginata CBS 339.88]|uniref:RRM domain-containing protein n=1 Tax=Galerina marginata (strain CBS 339.88) TaxID=685588 RepID=A0A067TBJ9_GALM3|nr:hypothetical protein GALMADRAFT_247808 [Galerina marginata CBS 339.88]